MRISDWSSDVCSSDLSKVVPVTATAHSRSVEFPGVRIDVPRVSWVQGIADPERPRPRVRWVEPGAPPFRQSFVFFKSAPSEEVLLFLVRQRCSIAWLHEAVETLPDVAYTKIGRASCRERVCQYVAISVGAGYLKK